MVEVDVVTVLKAIPLSLIRPSPFQMPTFTDPEAPKALTDSIVRDGQQRARVPRHSAADPGGVPQMSSGRRPGVLERAARYMLETAVEWVGLEKVRELLDEHEVKT